MDRSNQTRLNHLVNATAPAVKFELEKLSFTITSLTRIPMIRFTTILMKMMVKVTTLIQSTGNFNLNSDVYDELVDFNGFMIEDDEDDESAPEFDDQGQ